MAATRGKRIMEASTGDVLRLEEIATINWPLVFDLLSKNQLTRLHHSIEVYLRENYNDDQKI